jgi:hypothetical protein
MHDPSRLGIERVATVQHGEIVPHQHIAHAPPMAHGKRKGFERSTLLTSAPRGASRFDIAAAIGSSGWEIDDAQ